MPCESPNGRMIPLAEHAPPFRVPAETAGKSCFLLLQNLPRVKYHLQAPSNVVIDLHFRANQSKNAINRWLGLRTASTNEK